MKKGVKYFLLLLGAAAILVSGVTLFITNRQFKLDRYSARNFTAISVDELKNDGRVTFDRSLMLVNGEHSLPEDFAPTVVKFENTEAYLDECVLQSFSVLRETVNDKFGQKLLIMSAYRDSEHQKEIYDADNDGVAAKPGTSEHETGLGIDVYVKYHAGKGFLKSDEGKFVNKHCGDYGFIIRYPKHRKSITGYDYEPWHIRYVGQPHSALISDNSLTLEEYLDSLKIGEFYLYDGYVISKQSGGELEMPNEFGSAVISPDNCGNYIVTVRL